MVSEKMMEWGQKNMCVFFLKKNICFFVCCGVWDEVAE